MMDAAFAGAPTPRYHCGTCYRSDAGPDFPIGWRRSPACDDVVFCDSCNAFRDEIRAREWDDGGEW